MQSSYCNFAPRSCPPQVETASDTLYTISYSFVDCGDNQPAEMTLKARVRKCEDAMSVLQQPVNLLEARVASVPAKCESRSPAVEEHLWRMPCRVLRIARSRLLALCSLRDAEA